MANRLNPLALPILDGFVLRKETDNHAIAPALIPCRDSLQQNSPMTGRSPISL